MKQIIFILCLLPTLLFAQYPNSGNKARLGYQTTGDGLIWRGVAADTVTKPRTINNAYFQLDTVNGVLRRYIATRGKWQTVGASVNIDSLIYATRYWVGQNFFPIIGGTLTGTGGAGYLGLLAQSSDPSTPASGFKLFANSAHNLAILDRNGWITTLDISASSNRFFTFPSTGGTFALGTGTTNRIPIWTDANTLGSSNALYNSTTKRWTWDSPSVLELPMGTDAQRPSPATTSDFWYSTTSNGLEWYNGTRWAKVLESTANIFTAGSLIFADANGQAAQNNAQLFWNNSTNRLGVARNNPTFTLDVNGNARVGSLVLETNGFAGATGQGISQNNSNRSMVFTSQGATNIDNANAFGFSPYGGVMSLTNSGANRTMSLVDIQGTFQAPNFIGTKFGALRVRPTYNFVVSGGAPPYVEVNGILYDPTLNSMYVTAHNFLKATSGNIVFATGGSGALGMGTSTPNGSSIVDFNSTSKGSLLTRMNTTQRNTIVQSVLSATVTSAGSGYSSQPTMTITGGGGTGAIAFANLTAGAITSISILNQGENYTSTPTLTITGGGGTGGTGTLTLTPIPESLLFYNTDSTGFEYRGNASNYLQIATKQYARSLTTGLATTWLKPSLEAGDVTINGATSSDFRIQNTRIQFDGKLKVGSDSSFVHDPIQDTTFIKGFVRTGRTRYARLFVDGTDNSNPVGIDQYQYKGADVIKHGWEVDNVSVVGGASFTNVNFIEYNGVNHFSQASTLDFSGSYGRITHRFGRIYTTNQYAAKALFINSDTVLSRATDPLFTINNVQNGDQLNIYKNRTIQFNAYGTGIMEASDLSKTQSNYIAGFATDGTVLDIPINTELYNTITSTTSPQTLSSTRADNLINQGGTQATFTLNLPASPVDGQVCMITYNNAITALTIDGNGNTIVGSAVTTAVAGSQRKFKFYSGIGWIKQY
jgi:hypothetical protein